MTGSESFKGTVQYTNLAGERVRSFMRFDSLTSPLAQGIPGQNPIPVLLTLQIMRGGSSSPASYYSFWSAARLCCPSPWCLRLVEGGSLSGLKARLFRFLRTRSFRRESPPPPAG